jgi:4a-hydroxytetrahydrobiopterin dehydratase
MKKTLNDVELEELLRTHPEWKLQSGKLVREWTFKDFVEAMAFVNRIAEIAETAGHHPDIDIRYNRVLLGLESHDAGGITKRDAAMAAQITLQFGSPAPRSDA